MVRLVSSRVHRCYSQNGGQRSARNERLTDIMHAFSCTFLLINRNVKLLFGADSDKIGDTCGILGSVLGITANLIDLHATLTAHRMFYKWSRKTKKNGSFLSTPTKVDTLVSLLYLLGGFALAAFTSPISKNFKAGTVFGAGAAGSALHLAAAAITIIASLPSLDFKVPSHMARAQNSVVTFFLVGVATRLFYILSALDFIQKGVETPADLQWFQLAAELFVLIGSIVNFWRVTSLLTKVQYWANDDVKGDSGNSPRGLLSWFKSSRSSNEMSDLESDLEDPDMDSDYDRGLIQGRGQTSDRRNGWSKI